MVYAYVIVIVWSYSRVFACRAVIIRVGGFHLRVPLLPGLYIQVVKSLDMAGVVQIMMYITSDCVDVFLAGRVKCRTREG